MRSISTRILKASFGKERQLTSGGLVRLLNELRPNRKATTQAISLRRTCHSTPLSQKRKVVLLAGTPLSLKHFPKLLILRGVFGQGATDNGAGLKKQHIEIDPFAEGRSWYLNYTLLISGIVPRLIGFVSTKSKGGQSDNLSPFCYFQVVDHDPPVFVIDFTGRAERPKDTLRNLMETGGCTINVVSEHFIEAVNACSVDAPHWGFRLDFIWIAWGTENIREACPGPGVDFLDKGKPDRGCRPQDKQTISQSRVAAWPSSRRRDSGYEKAAPDERQGHIDPKVLCPVAQVGENVIWRHHRLSSCLE